MSKRKKAKWRTPPGGMCQFSNTHTQLELAPSCSVLSRRVFQHHTTHRPKQLQLEFTPPCRTPYLRIPSHTFARNTRPAARSPPPLPSTSAKTSVRRVNEARCDGALHEVSSPREKLLLGMILFIHSVLVLPKGAVTTSNDVLQRGTSSLCDKDFEESRTVSMNWSHRQAQAPSSMDTFPGFLSCPEEVSKINQVRRMKSTLI